MSGEPTRVPIPSSFPPGSKFWELDGDAIASVDGAFLVAWLGDGTAMRVPFAETLARGDDSIPARLSRDGEEITEAQFVVWATRNVVAT